MEEREPGTPRLGWKRMEVRSRRSAGVLETEATAAEASPSPASPGSHDGDAGG